MITTPDVNKLARVFVTKQENSEVISRLDIIIGELQAMREEQTVFAHRQAIHSEQVERLELKIFGKSFA